MRWLRDLSVEAVARVRFAILTRLASRVLWALWWAFKDDPDPKRAHVLRHVNAALAAGGESACRPGHCALDHTGRREWERAAIEAMRSPETVEMVAARLRSAPPDERVPATVVASPDPDLIGREGEATIDSAYELAQLIVRDLTRPRLAVVDPDRIAAQVERVEGMNHGIAKDVTHFWKGSA